MPESHYDAVNTFRRIKEETGSEDLIAAVLTLARSVSWINISLQVSDDGYPERLGKDIADAIENVTKDGSISVRLDGEMMNNVRAMVDLSGTMENGPVKRTSKSKRKTK